MLFRRRFVYKYREQTKFVYNVWYMRKLQDMVFVDWNVFV